MKANERVLKYLAGTMQENEKHEFESELKESELLQKELERQKEILTQLRNTQESAAESSVYFNNLLPNVKQRLEKKKKFRLVPGFAYALPVAAVIAYFILNPFSHSNNQSADISNTIAQMQDDSKTVLLTEIIEEDNSTSNLRTAVVSDSTSSEVLDRALASELFDSEDEKANYIDTDDLVNSLSKEEADAVYNSLLNKKIL